MSFTYRMTPEQGYALIGLDGRLTDPVQALPLLDEVQKMIDEGTSRFILDMDGLQYVNSSGLNLLIGLFTRARNGGGDVAIAGISDKVKQLMVTTRLDTVFKIHGSTEAAMEHINA